MRDESYSESVMSSTPSAAGVRSSGTSDPSPAPGVVFVDGDWYTPETAVISVFDHGLLYGDGVFEGIRFYGGRVFKLHRHVERLYRSAQRIGITPPVPSVRFEEILLEACARSRLTDGYLRPIVTRGRGDLGLDPRRTIGPSMIVICSTIRPFGPEGAPGLRTIISSLRKTPAASLDPNAKTLNYLNSVLAKSEANARHADEAILLDLDGNVAEASAENVFVVRDGRLYTPPTSTNLEGITRETVLELADGQFRCEVRLFDRTFLTSADEVFLAGTGGEILPVLEVDEVPIGTGAPGPVTRWIQRAYHELVRSTGTPIPYRDSGRA